MSTSLLVLMLLSQRHVYIDSPLATLTDGGTGIQVTCDNCSSAAGPGGGLSNVELRATPVPVSLTSTSITGSVATTGTYWQATQPVSLATAPTTPVTGTFWQATQPVSGTFYQATQPVSIASMPTTAVTMADRTYSHRAVAYAASPTPIAAASQGGAIGDLEGRQYVNTSHPRAIVCNLKTTATTSTQVTGCELVASNSIWITSITVGGGVATGATAPAIVQSGTSTACTGPVVLYYCGHVAQSTCTISFPTPIKATAAHGLCLLDATVGTKWVTVTGYVAP